MNRRSFIKNCFLTCGAIITGAAFVKQKGKLIPASFRGKQFQIGSKATHKLYEGTILGDPVYKVTELKLISVSHNKNGSFTCHYEYTPAEKLKPIKFGNFNQYKKGLL